MGLDNPIHLLIVAVVIVLIFGAKRLPQLGRSAGKGIREIKTTVGLDEIKAAAQSVREPLSKPLSQTLSQTASTPASPQPPPAPRDTNPS
jgi:sec-independent protein translocase protein TatA